VYSRHYPEPLKTLVAVVVAAVAVVAASQPVLALVVVLLLDTLQEPLQASPMQWVRLECLRLKSRLGLGLVLRVLRQEVLELVPVPEPEQVQEQDQEQEQEQEQEQVQQHRRLQLLRLQRMLVPSRSPQVLLRSQEDHFLEEHPPVHLKPMVRR
jgi:hypothetical protein